jgi:hypothetical protein
MRVVARRSIAHDGVVYAAGETLAVTAEQAEALIACGAAGPAPSEGAPPDEAAETGAAPPRRRR